MQKFLGRNAIKYYSRLTILLIIGLLFIGTASAWNDTGHKIVAKIAYENLTPTARRRVDELTSVIDKKHKSGVLRFMLCSTLPDRIRHDGVYIFDKWHYTDIMMSANAKDIRNLSSNKSSKLIPHYHHLAHRETHQPGNIMEAIDQIEAILTSKYTNDYEKGLFLSFLVHLVGDIHQPLHVVSYVSKSFPHGDKGGNLYPIHTAAASNLHEYWDGDLGLLTENSAYPLKHFLRLVHRVEHTFRQSQLADKIADLDPTDWARESMLIAKKFTYNLHPNDTPSEDYINTGRRIAEERIALAGYRLARILNAELGEQG